MNKSLVDIVNFNADASCLPSEQWLSYLEGGEKSILCQWLNSYVDNRKKVNLGIVGSTLADIKFYNSAAIEIINNNPDVFEVMLRPWSHDIGIYRSENTFKVNVNLGVGIIKKELDNFCNFFLSPEFMINSRQIELLDNLSIEGVFINPNRFDKQTATRIPSHPYMVKATGGREVKCIPFQPNSAQHYLRSCQLGNMEWWNDGILSSQAATYFSWRDGESFMLVPEGLEREKSWLIGESEEISRLFVSELEVKYTANSSLPDDCFRSYPINSFLAWMQEMKMLWFVHEVQRIEDKFDRLNAFEKVVFFQLINSDILASVEKRSPVIKIKQDGVLRTHTINRAEKGFEGEEFLIAIREGVVDYKSGYGKKFAARQHYVEQHLHSLL